MDVDTAYPLKRHFMRRILPGLLLLIFFASAITYGSARWTVEKVYLELARQRAEVIAASVKREAPDAWARLRTGRLAPGDNARLRTAFGNEAEELKLMALKVYDLAGRVLYSTDPASLGKLETGKALRSVVADMKSSLVRKDEGGNSLIELYVPYLDQNGQLAAVFELYEPVGYLDGILLRSGLIVSLVPAALFLLLAAAAAILVGRAQRHIDGRAHDLIQLKERLESFVSSSAVNAAREGGVIPSERVRITLLYSDARDFTGYSEANPPERVVWYLNELMTIQVDAIGAQGGDVDKMIGDALLARFTGRGAEGRALAAARAILGEVARAELPRLVGIGIYTGDVISGAIGPTDRRDFTVIGDGVNVSARLCSAAAAGEIVADEATVAADNGAEWEPPFGAVEALTVKGRLDPVAARRWRNS
ncbi:MAG: adenylate/guanylate cyclase domain-containing protein [Rhodospirillales bacterium]|nr:adenylate/guanylate cyclase domain-containing protein [Rhodospirillales bacterium]